MARLFSLVLAAVLSLAFASAADAFWNIGHGFYPTADCNISETALQTGVPSGFDSYTVPANGVITEWDFDEGMNIVPDLTFKVARHTTGDNYTIVGSSPAGTQTAGTNTPYSVRIPVQAGDIIGIYENGGNCGGDNSDPAATYAYSSGINEPLGSSSPFTQSSGFIFPVSALEEPDADGDGWGDETQDQCPTDASTHGPCPKPTPPGGGTPPATPPGKDTTAPAVTASGTGHAKLSKLGSLAFFINSSENATGHATGTIGLPGGSRTVRFKTAKVKLVAGQRSKITLKLSKSGLKAVRAALKHHNLKAKVTVTVKDAAGNTTVKRLTIKLKR